MATLTDINPSLTDVTKRLDPNGKVDRIAEILRQVNPILDDMVWVEGNLPTGHKSTIRTGLPTPTWRKLYGGVQPTKSTTAQVVDTCGMLRAYGQVDKDLADLANNKEAFILSENKGHMQGMSHEVAQTLFSGDESTEPEAFTGFHTRFNAVSSANNSENVFQDVAGSGTNYQSIYLIGWGSDTVHGIYPQGSTAGLEMKNLGEVTVENANEYVGAGSHQGGMYQAYRTYFSWDCGLTVRDWQYVVRLQVAFDDITSAGAGTGGDADLNDFMLQMVDQLPSLEGINPCFYMSRGMVTKLRQQSISKINQSTLTWDQLAGKSGRQLFFSGIKVNRTDALAVTETVIS